MNVKLELHEHGETKTVLLDDIPKEDCTTLVEKLVKGLLKMSSDKDAFIDVYINGEKEN